MDTVQRFVDAVRNAVIGLPGCVGVSSDYGSGHVGCVVECPVRGTTAVAIARTMTGWVVRWWVGGELAEMPIRTPRGVDPFDPTPRNIRCIRDAVFARFPEAPPTVAMGCDAHNDAWARHHA